MRSWEASLVFTRQLIAHCLRALRCDANRREQGICCHAIDPGTSRTGEAGEGEEASAQRREWRHALVITAVLLPTLVIETRRLVITCTCLRVCGSLNGTRETLIDRLIG